MNYDDAVGELYRAPHAEFVAERKRLAGELKPSDKPGAAKLAKLGRPPISAWAVNQLYWQARPLYDRMLETAERLRAGDLGASAEHRESIAKLRAKAAELLDAAGHGSTESTLRRVMTTLSALAVGGGFAPDPPGALAEDRDPPGFDAVIGLAANPSPSPSPSPKPPAPPSAPDPEAAADAAAKKERAEAQARRKAEDEERARRSAELHKLESALRTARTDAAVRARNVESLRAQLADAERLADKTAATVTELEAELAKLTSE